MALTKSSSFKRVKLKMSDRKMSATAGSFATSGHRKKK